MYQSNGDEIIIQLNDLPMPSGGAPMPIILSDDLQTVIAYYTNEDSISESQEGEQIAIVTFKISYATLVSPPNDEAFIGHPLYKMGLKSYFISKIENSPWISSVMIMNSVHPYHNPQTFEKYSHYIIPFKESVFECLAEKYGYQLITGRMSDAFEIMRRNLFENS